MALSFSFYVSIVNSDLNNFFFLQGPNAEHLGIYIKAVVPGGAADRVSLVFCYKVRQNHKTSSILPLPTECII